MYSATKKLRKSQSFKVLYFSGLSEDLYAKYGMSFPIHVRFIPLTVISSTVIPEGFCLVIKVR